MTTIRLRGRREKGYILLLSPRPIDDKIKATFDRDSKSSRNVPQRLCYALTISILFFSFFFFLNSRCPVTAAFSIAQIPRGNTGGRDVKLGRPIRETIHDPHESSTIPINFPFRILFDNWRGSSEVAATTRRNRLLQVLNSFVTSSQMVIESTTFTICSNSVVPSFERVS